MAPGGNQDACAPADCPVLGGHASAALIRAIPIIAGGLEAGTILADDHQEQLRRAEWVGERLSQGDFLKRGFTTRHRRE